MAPPSKARPRVAYDLGRRGQSLPDDWHDDPEMAGAYEMGVDDRDAAEAGAPRRKGPPASRPRSRAVRHDPTPPGDNNNSDDTADDTGRRRPSGTADPADAVSWSAHPLSRGSGGGLFLGIIGYCIGRAFFTDGPHGIWRWYSAKFMNKPLPKTGSTAPTTPTSPASPASPASTSGRGRVVSV